MKSQKSHWIKCAVSASIIFTIAFGVTYFASEKGESNEN